MKIPDKYWTGKPLLESRLPWLTPGALRALDKIVKADMEVLEFGCGGSTLFFSDRFCKVRSWDTSAKWFSAIRKRQCPGVVFFSNLKRLLELPGPYDIILVDNSDSPSSREYIAREAAVKLKPGGCFILDNYARYRISLPERWTKFFYDDPHWSGSGTMIAIDS